MPCVTSLFFPPRTPCFTSKLQTKEGVKRKRGYMTDRTHFFFSCRKKTDSKFSERYSPDIGGIEDARGGEVVTTSRTSLVLERVGGASVHPIPSPDTHVASAESAASAGTIGMHPSHPSAHATNTPHSTHTIQPSDPLGGLTHASNTSPAAQGTESAVTQAKNAAS
jgi:hypothetical protein